MEILLSKIMHERNLTVRQVEQMTKVPKSTINDIMNGKSPRVDNIGAVGSRTESQNI